MALIEKIRAIADAIRYKTGITDMMTLDEMAETIECMDTSGGLVAPDRTYILVDENGYEVPASLTDEVVELTATVNDIRIGTTAVTEEGVVEGEKDIPAYHTYEGHRKISGGSAIRINLYSDSCNYTKFQALICDYGTSINTSVSTEKVSINDKVYAVNSTIELATVVVDSENQAIDLAIVNEKETPVVIRFFTYKEEY